jgi:hypothetical protein
MQFVHDVTADLGVQSGTPTPYLYLKTLIRGILPPHFKETIMTKIRISETVTVDLEQVERDARKLRAQAMTDLFVSIKSSLKTLNEKISGLLLPSNLDAHS